MLAHWSGLGWLLSSSGTEIHSESDCEQGSACLLGQSAPSCIPTPQQVVTKELIRRLSLPVWVRPSAEMIPSFLTLYWNYQSLHWNVAQIFDCQDFASHIPKDMKSEKVTGYSMFFIHWWGKNMPLILAFSIPPPLPQRWCPGLLHQSPSPQLHYWLWQYSLMHLCLALLGCRQNTNLWHFKQHQWHLDFIICTRYF